LHNCKAVHIVIGVCSRGAALNLLRPVAVVIVRVCCGIEILQFISVIIAQVVGAGWSRKAVAYVVIGIGLSEGALQQTIDAVVGVCCCLGIRPSETVVRVVIGVVYVCKGGPALRPVPDPRKVAAVIIGVGRICVVGIGDLSPSAVIVIGQAVGAIADGDELSMVSPELT